MMHAIWRASFIVLFIAGTALGLPAALASAGGAFKPPESIARGPAARGNDNDHSICFSGNPRKRKKCHYNGWDNDNWSPNDPSFTGARVAIGDLGVEVWRSTDRPVVNSVLMLAINGDGEPIERVWWWAEGPGDAGPSGDDLAHLGEQSYDCAGNSPCAWSWTVVPRNVGTYVVHARARSSSSGREVQTDWRFSVSES